MPNEYRLDLGGTVIALRCRPAELAVGLANWFGLPSATGDPHVILDLAPVPHDDTPALPTSLVQTKTVGPGGVFDIAEGLITGHYDPLTGRGALFPKATLVRGRLMRILEQILYQAFESARLRAGLDAFLIHSSAVIADGRGFLFVGPSEAGKTTIARNSSHLHVLGDEMNLVVATAAGLVVQGTPFNGTFRQKRPGKAPLAGVFLLRQAAGHGLFDLPEADAATALAAEMVPPVGLDQMPGPDTVPAMVDRAVLLAEKSLLKGLDFLPDAGFWNVIARSFGLEGCTPEN